mmetsp:Transcript_58402/g.167597  ORF Transcript_58402/g.167597 Transcript_58402/m.167597 type:complete len:357 (-) Transcript_58402:1518-2588(-)
MFFAGRELREPSAGAAGGTRLHEEPPKALQRVVQVADLEVPLPVCRRLAEGPSLQVDAADGGLLRRQPVVAVEGDIAQDLTDAELVSPSAAFRIAVVVIRRHNREVHGLHRQRMHRGNVVAKHHEVVLRVDEEDLCIRGHNLRKGELDLCQRLRDGVAVRDDEPTNRIHYEADAEAPYERRVELILALDKIRGVLVGEACGHGAQHGLDPADGLIPTRRIAQRLFSGAGNITCTFCNAFFRGPGGSTSTPVLLRPRLFRQGRRTCGRSWRSGQRQHRRSLAPPDIGPLRREAPSAQRPQGALHAHRGPLSSALVGRGVEPRDLEGFAVGDTGEGGLEVLQAANLLPLNRGDDGVVG